MAWTIVVRLPPDGRLLTLCAPLRPEQDAWADATADEVADRALRYLAGPVQTKNGEEP